MSRQSRQISETGFYHIIMRGNNKAYIFEDQRDKSYFMDVLKKVENDELIKVVAWCIMDNHVHLIMKVEEEQLSIAMKRINIKYAMHYHKVHRTVGHVFQDRFKSEVIDTDEYMMMVLRYVHHNPTKAKMVKRPIDYKWSSYKGYVNDKYLIHVDMYSTIMGYFNNSVESFEAFHKQTDNMDYLEIKEDQEKYRMEKAQAIIQRYCDQYGITDSLTLHQQPEVLNPMLKEIKSDCHLSLRKLSELTEISVTQLHSIVKREQV